MRDKVAFRSYFSRLAASCPGLARQFDTNDFGKVQKPCFMINTLASMSLKVLI